MLRRAHTGGWAIDFSIWRWLGAGSLAIVEYVVLGVLVSSGPLAERIRLVHWIPWLIGLAITGFAAVVVLGGKRIPERLAELEPGTGRGHHPLVFLALHAAAYLGFFLLTLRLFADPPGVRGDLRLWLALWGAGGLLAFALLLASLLPLRAVVALLWRARKGLLAAALVGLASALAAPHAADLWRPLSVLTLRGGALVLSLFTSDLDIDLPTLRLGAGGFSVLIWEACSGIEGLALILIFVAAWLIWSRTELRWPQALLLLPLGAAAALAANIARIAGLIAVGSLLSPEVAVGAFHSRAGWILFCGVALGLTLASKRLPYFSRRPAEPGVETWNPTAAWLGPLLAAVAVALLTESFSTGFDALYPLRLVAALLVLWLQRADLPRPRAAPAWWAVALGTAVFAGWVLLEPAPDPAAVARFTEGLGDLSASGRAAWLALRVAGAVLVIPLIEEMAFRGFLLRRLVALDFTSVRFTELHPLAIALSSLAFGAVHHRWLAGTLAGLAFAFAANLRGRLSDAVIAHATTNALICAWVLSGGRWWLW